MHVNDFLIKLRKLYVIYASCINSVSLMNNFCLLIFKLHFHNTFSLNFFVCEVLYLLNFCS